jgi:hypothetical protein
MTVKLYKVLGKNGEAVHGGDGAWHRDGEWMPPIEGELLPCQNGYHLSRKEDLLLWLAPTIWEAEYKGERLNHDKKVIVRQARITKKLSWDDTIARLFVIDCAERVMHLGDEVVFSTVLAVAYLYAIGEASEDELALARDAVRSATKAATKAAARSAAWAVTWAVARTAAWTATRATAWHATRAVARSAARAVARTAAWAAAEDRAVAAAAAAAEVWAEATAEAIETEWQTNRLFEYLEGDDDA